MGKFEVTLPWDIEDGVEVELTVTGDYAYSKGNKRGHPDTHSPAWTELDISSVRNERGCPIPPAIVGELCAQDEFLRAIENKVLQR